MHLSAADQLLASEQLVVGEHLPVTGSLSYLHFGGHRERHRTRGDNADAQPGGRVDQDFPVTAQIRAQAVEGIDDAAVHFDHATLQFGDIGVGQLVQQLGRASRQPAGLEVDEVELLLDPQGSGHKAPHLAHIN